MDTNYLNSALKKLAADAPGLPDREEEGEINKLRERVSKLIPYVLQRHKAERAGPHYDLRLQSPEGLLSWAIPKAQLPESGEARRAIRQPLHSTDYKDFEGEIGEGYGKGEVTKEKAGKVLITDVEGDPIERIDFTIPGRDPERYRLSKQDDGDWLFLGMTPTKKPEHEKVHYDKVEEGEVDELLDKVTEDRPMSAKIDGALGLLKFLDDKAEVMSHRTRKDSDKPIIHTERVAPELLQRKDIPEELRGKTLEGEIYATRDGETIKPQEISGLLNSSIEKARKESKEKGLDWRMALFDALPRDASRDKKERIIDAAMEALPGFTGRPPQAETPEAARDMLEGIVSGEHPLSSEGVVFDTEEGKRKYKPTEETDVVVRGFTPGTGRLSDTIGAIQYSLTPEGDIKGKVGTGLTDKMRRRISENEDEWINRVARIKAQQQYPSGAYRAPVFKSFHEDYGPSEWGPTIEKRMGKASSIDDSIGEAVNGFMKAASDNRDVYDKYNLDPKYEDVARTLHGESLHYTQPELNALAQVIRNRARSKRHPDDPSSVVKEKWQFSPWNYRFQDQSDKRVRRVKKRMTQPLSKIPHLKRISKAIRQANKDNVNSVRGARHFHATSMDEKPSWASKLINRGYSTKEIGDHTFYLPPQSQQGQQTQRAQQSQMQQGSDTTPSQNLGVKPVPRTYEIKPGDSLSAIANEYGIPGWERIATHNDIENPNKIQAGQELNLNPFRRAGDYPK